MYGITELKGDTDLLSIYSRHIDLANSLAWKSNFRTKMSCLLIRGGSILSVGHNYVTPERKGYFGCSVHAETDAILSCRANTHNSKALVYRFSRKSNYLTSSEPCSRCLSLLENRGIKCVIAVDKYSRLFKSKL